MRSILGSTKSEKSRTIIFIECRTLSVDYYYLSSSHHQKDRIINVADATRRMHPYYALIFKNIIKSFITLGFCSRPRNKNLQSGQLGNYNGLLISK